MKTIGLIGGMSWKSTVEYYRIINELTNERLGAHHSAKMILYSLDFEEVAALQYNGEWDKAAEIIADAAKKVERAGADLILICTNTMHKIADQVQSRLQIPLIHIIDATAEAIKRMKVNKVGLLGTKFTMEEDFYKDRLKGRHGIEIVIPDPEDRERINEIIYNELCLGIIRESSRNLLKTVINKLTKKGVEGVILGCTELPLIIEKKDSPVPIIDTTRIHAEKAVEMALT